MPLPDSFQASVYSRSMNSLWVELNHKYFFSSTFSPSLCLYQTFTLTFDVWWPLTEFLITMAHWNRTLKTWEALLAFVGIKCANLAKGPSFRRYYTNTVVWIETSVDFKGRCTKSYSCKMTKLPNPIYSRYTQNIIWICSNDNENPCLSDYIQLN